VIGQDDVRHECLQRLLEARARVDALAHELHARFCQVAFDQGGVCRHVFEKQDP